jgi:hypothetical protein
MREREQFRPMIAMRRSLPGAIFWSMLASWFIPPAIANVPPFSIAAGMLNSVIGFAAIVGFGAITPIWSGLAIIHALKGRGHDAVRRCFLVFNVAGLIGWAVVVKLSLDTLLLRV